MGYGDEAQTSERSQLNDKRIGGYGSATKAAPPPALTLQQALDEQEKALYEERDVISQLEDRLMLVTVSPDSAGLNAKATTDPPQSPNICDRIRANTRVSQTNAARIMELMRRVQL